MTGPELEQARESIAATRSVVKSQMRSLRTCLSFLTDLEQQLDALTHPERTAQGGKANEHTQAAAG
ncbi:MAG TPA: hypothetical protein VG265_15495 [Gaiellaceae bacterium]|jgi:hypothetical protein|nr:hypothetical protein [Gaiellaceae bacterium]